MSHRGHLIAQRSPVLSMALAFAIATAPLHLRAQTETPLAPTAQAEKTALSELQFRDMVISNHLDIEKIGARTIGIEVELAGLDARKAVDLLIAALGGRFAGEEASGTETALIIADSAIGKIKIEPVNLRRLLNRYNETGGNSVSKSQVVQGAVDQIDGVFGQIEIVTEPLNYKKVKQFALAMDSLNAEAGARGTSNFGRLISVQSNIGIDPTDSVMMTNLLDSYYSNSDAIEKDIKPAALRRGFLGDISERFRRLLANRSWKPSPAELFDVYKTESPGKLAKLNLFNALIMNPENASRFEQPKAGKARIPRPVAEFREADTKVSTEQNPTLFSQRLMREVDFSIAMVQSAEKGERLTLDGERERMAANLRAPNRMLGDVEEPPRVKDVIQGAYKRHVRTTPVAGASVLLGNRAVLDAWGLGGTDAEIETNTLKRFAVRVDGNALETDISTNDTTAPMATEHHDGAGGRGDGRALTFEDLHGFAQNSKGNGLTPYVIQRHAMWLGWHIGGVDGKASLSEGVRSYLTGEILHHLGIASERVAALIDNNDSSDANGIEAKTVSSIIVRQLPGGGIRNSHLRAWDNKQIRQGLEYLKSIAQFETGRRQTDATFITLDATRAAQQAARLQDHYVVHGALTAGNILAYPGIVDLNTVTFLDAPDAEFTPIAQRSRFGNQANRLKALVLERQRAYAKTNSSLSKVDGGRIFDEEFSREISILALQRLGLERHEAVVTYQRDPESAKAYSEALWNAQFKNLYTDFRALQKDFVFSEGEMTDEGAQKLIDLNSRDPQKLLDARRPWWQKLANTLRGSYSEVDRGTVKELAQMARSLIAASYAANQQSSEPINRAQYMDKLKANAQSLANLHLPSKTEVSTAADAVIAEKLKTGRLEFSIGLIDRLLAGGMIQQNLLTTTSKKEGREAKDEARPGLRVTCDHVL